MPHLFSNRRLFVILFLQSHLLNAQSVIPVTFRYYPAVSGLVRVFVPGSFNNWGPNSAGIIAPDAPSRMAWSDWLGCYIYTLPLQENLTCQYKFHEHPSNSWITDPLNPEVNTGDNNNSVLTVRNGMLFQMQPAENKIFTEFQIDIIAAVLLIREDSLLADQSGIELDGVQVTDLTDCYTDSLGLIRYRTQPLANGQHEAVIRITTRDGLMFADSTRFIIKSAPVFFITPDHEDIMASPKTIRWRVNLSGVSLDSVVLCTVGESDSVFVPQSNTDYAPIIRVPYGTHRYVVRVRETQGALYLSDTLTFHFPEPVKPVPGIEMQSEDGSLIMTASVYEPQGQAVNYTWENGPMNVPRIQDLDGRTGTSLTIALPESPGDYEVRLTATDLDGHTGTIQTFFIIDPQMQLIVPDLTTVPQWVRNARVYSLFIKGFTDGGRLNDAMARLDYIKDMGFNVIWLLPVMDVEGELDQDVNIGYNIVDFYQVDSGYGTNQDFKDFVTAAHERGIRVILDVTPNHTSRSHPFALDAKTMGPYSRYWDFYQHEIIPHNSNGLGQSVSPEGIVYYSGFTEALLNWNWSDAEARQYMIDVYQYWVQMFDIDGFRLDAYWGPSRRYGRDAFDRPLRTALRSVKADILLLGETQGVGPGSELQYADQAGGMDMGYDWTLKDALTPFPSISVLDEKLFNGGYRPGENSFFFRFLENHDELRVANRYNSVERTIPVSTAVFLSTGIPMLYQGQEVGMGYRMSGSKDYLARATVDWNNEPVSLLTPHYQKLAQIRAQFPSFRRQAGDSNLDGLINASDHPVQPRLQTSSNSVYAYGRPWPDENGIVVMNFSDQPQYADIYLNANAWMEWDVFPRPDMPFLFLNNLYTNQSEPFSEESDTLPVALAPYGAAVFIVSPFEKQVQCPALPASADPCTPGQSADRFRLQPNFPNPFNGDTVIPYILSETASVRIDIFNLRGQCVQTFDPGVQKPGFYTVRWNGRDRNVKFVSSGLYIVQLKCNQTIFRQKIMFIR